MTKNFGKKITVSIRCSSASTAERVAQDMQARGYGRFYSLLVSEYSGTLEQLKVKITEVTEFLFAARQRVQRNSRRWTPPSGSGRFYSLLVSEYSGTLPPRPGL